jgi:hypothetical protein
MKTLKITIVVVISSFLMILSSNALEKRIGIAAGFTNVSADGTETLKDSSQISRTEADESTIIPSIFAELAMDNGFGLGIEHVPGSADINSSARSREDDDAESAGGNKATAEIDGLTSIYLIKTFESGFFVKAGRTSTTVNTKEVLATGSTYKNVDVDGKLIGLGMHRTTDSGLFYRVSGEYTDYDSLSLNGSESGADAASFNKIKADVDTVAFKFSIGKAF